MRHLSGRGVLMSSHENILYLNILNQKMAVVIATNHSESPLLTLQVRYINRTRISTTTSADWDIHNTRLWSRISMMFPPFLENPWMLRLWSVVVKVVLYFPKCNDSSRFYNLLFLSYSYDTHSLQNIQWKVQCIWKSVFRHRELNTQCSTQSHIAIYQDENKSTKSALPHARHYLSRYRIPKCN